MESRFGELVGMDGRGNLYMGRGLRIVLGIWIAWIGIRMKFVSEN